MSKLSRRSILGRLFTSVPAIAIAATDTSILSRPAEAEPSPVHEKADLSALFDRFDIALAELKAAAENKLAAEQKFLELVRPVPPKLLLRYEERHWLSGTPTNEIVVGRGWSYFAVKTPEYYQAIPTRFRATTVQLKSLKAECSAHSPQGRFSRRLLPLAESYERGLKAAARKSKVVAALEHYNRAEIEAGALARDVAQAVPITLNGLRRKALAVSRAEELGNHHTSHFRTLSADSLSADVLRLCEEVQS